MMMMTMLLHDGTHRQCCIVLIQLIKHAVVSEESRCNVGSTVVLDLHIVLQNTCDYLTITIQCRVVYSGRVQVTRYISRVGGTLYTCSAV